MVFKNKHDNNEEHFWLSATDMMAALSIFFILLLMLAVLFLNTSKDEVFTPLDASENPEGVFASEPEGLFWETSATEDEEREEPSVSGETQAPTERASESPNLSGTDEGFSPYAAVFVTVVDSETGNTIKKKGIEFELYADKNGTGGLQTLHAYYPEKVEYTKYQTNDQGIFYLPEKISYGWYSLHNTVAPEGYLPDSDTDFEIDEGRHWSEPYMIKVALKPMKNIIRIRAEDSATKEPVSEAVYSVTAAEDIKAADGTVRYSSGDKVGEITTDENGYADTKDLYLGKYNIKQTYAPGFYAVNNKAVAASAGKNSDNEENIVKLECYKTSVTVRLTDERTEEPIKGAIYSVEGRDDLVTGEDGSASISELHKSTTYKLTLSELPDGYTARTHESTFTVDENGLINGEAEYVTEDTAYNLCLSVSVQDMIFGKSCTGIDLSLIDENGEAEDTWTSNGDDHIITGLSAGSYVIQHDNDEKHNIAVEIKDTAELQSVRMRLTRAKRRVIALLKEQGFHISDWL